MHSDISTVVWKEWREVLRMGGSKRRAVLRLVFSIGLLGVLWPWQLGQQFVTSQLAVLLAAFTASMYVAGVVPDSFAGERERHTLETLLASRLPDRAILFGKIVALVTYGLGAAAVMLTFGWVTVNVVHRGDRILFYDVATLVSAILFSIIAAGLMGAVGVIVSLRAATVKQAQQVLTTAVLILLFLPIIALPTIPAEWQRTVASMIREWGAATIAAAVAALLVFVQVVLYAIASARVKRARLILEQ
jgi:ABC-2 type transport system permease protein